MKVSINLLIIVLFSVSALDGCTTKTSSASSLLNSLLGGSGSLSVLDYGQKGTVAGVARGTYSDMGMIPGTASPVVAYFDAGTLTVKLNYWNGSAFVTEVISGESSGAYLRMAFSPTGLPMVFWASGVNLKMAMRSASLTVAGAAWSAGVIDSGVAPRAIEVAVNPKGQVGVVFMTDTATTGRAKFLYCDTPCSGPSAFQNMAATPYIDNTAIIAATTATGIAWCEASATSYYPVVSYSTTSAVRYAVCQNALASCLTNTNWTIQQVAAVASVSSKVLLNPATVGDIPKVMLLGATGLTPYMMGTTACSTTPAAFSAGSAIGTASSGTEWQKLIQDSTGMFHLFANEGTTSVRYYNSSSTTFDGAWNGAGVIETITLPAAANGGAAYDPGTQTLYASYPQGAAPYDLHLGRVQNITVASSSGMFSIYTPDETGTIQLTAANSQIANTSMASNSFGTPGIAYTDYSVGAVANAKLKYAQQSVSTTATQWNMVTVPGTLSPEFPSLAFDGNNLPWIGYFDANSNRFYLVNNSQSNGEGTWMSYIFPAIPSGAPAALPQANQVAVAMLYSGGTVNPVMIITDTNTTSHGIKAAVFNISTLSWSAVTTLDTIASGAANLSADFEASGTIILGYRDFLTNKVKYTTSTNGTTWTAPITIGALGQGVGLNMRFNPFTGQPAASYFDWANNQVIYNVCSNTPAACATSGWAASVIDSSAGVSTLAATNQQLLSTTIAFDAIGIPTILYPTGQAALGSLRSAVVNLGVVTLSTLASGANGNLPGIPTVNFGIAGWNVASTSYLSVTTVSYIGPANWLYVNSFKH